MGRSYNLSMIKGNDTKAEVILHKERGREMCFRKNGPLFYRRLVYCIYAKNDCRIL